VATIYEPQSTMNATNLQHAVIALLMMAFIGGTTGAWAWGAILPAAVFFAREHAQYERKLKDQGAWDRVDAFKVWAWPTDAILDFVAPAVSVLAVWAALHLAGIA
jgi:hypothetical protein